MQGRQPQGRGLREQEARGRGPAGGSGEPVELPGPLVDADWLRANLGRPGLVVLDATVRLQPLPGTPQAEAIAAGTAPAPSGRADWERARIPGSRFADLAGELADPDAGFSFAMPDPARFTAALARLGVGPDSRVVVYDDDARMWSTRLWWALREIGLETVAVLDGGWPAWVAAGGPVESGPPEPADPLPEGAGWGEPPAARGTFVGRQEVLDIVERGDPGRVLVCALSADVFRGVASPIPYARPGHIPGSRNLPAKDTLLDADGRFRPLPELAAALAGLPADAEVVAYCGGGISATLLAFALTLVGRDRVRIYDGSLEEWAADPDLPLVVGPEE